MGPKVMTTELGFMYRYIPTKPMFDYAALALKSPSTRDSYCLAPFSTFTLLSPQNY